MVGNMSNAECSNKFECGACYRLVCHTMTQKAACLERLATQPGTAIVAQNGGLLNHLSVRENLLLPIAYQEPVVGQLKLELERDMTELLGACLDLPSFTARQSWLDRSPSALSMLEKRLAGFIRALLFRPEILVFDHVFEGLGRIEINHVLSWRQFFHCCFPFRTLIFVDLDSNALPELTECSTIAP